MDPSLAHHVRYLELRAAALEPAELHREQIAAYRECLERARAAPDTAAYLAATGNLLPITRAEWVDRYRNAAALYRGIGDAGGARSAELLAEAAAGAGSHRTLLAATMGAKVASRGGAGDAAALVSHLLRALFEWRIEFSARRGERLAAVGEIWRRVLVADPDFAPARLREHPPYRHRIPFADPALAEIERWLEAAEAEAGPIEAAEPEPRPEAPRLPGDLDLEQTAVSAGEVAAGYRAALAALDASDPASRAVAPLYRRILELAAAADSGDALLVAMAEEDIEAAVAREPLRAGARAALSGLDAERQPLAAGHYRRLVEDLGRARTPTAVEHVQLAAELQLAVESSWLDLLCRIALAPLALAAALEQSEAAPLRAGVAESERIARALLGAASEALLENPALWSLFRGELFERGQLAPIETQVIRGEVALDLAGALRGAQIQWAIDQVETAGAGFEEAQDRIRRRLAERRFDTPEALRGHLLALRDAALAGAEIEPGPAAPPPLRLWGQDVPLAELHLRLPDPPRPLPRLADV